MLSRGHLPYRSPMVATWFFAVAFIVVLMILVGGMTRLTDSGLSITEWAPVTGAIPPLSQSDWLSEFAKYKQIPEYQQINKGMSLDEFKVIYWWEWGHRFLGRLIGLVYFIPMVIFLVRGDMPARLIGRSVLILALGGLQGFIGWWMVSSGLADRVDVAPERLMTHLSLALLILVMLVWAGLDAGSPVSRGRGAVRWQVAGFALLGLVFVQSMLGALVAGNDAGMIYNDWPLMNGRLVPLVDWTKGTLHAFLHDQALVQFNHRMTAYALLVYATVFTVMLYRGTRDPGLRGAALLACLLIWGQAVLGIATLVSVSHIAFGIAHQLMAAIVLIVTTVLCWRIVRADRVFAHR